MTSDFIRLGGNRDTGRIPCDNRGRDQTDAAASQEMPRLPATTTGQGEGGEGFSLELSRGSMALLTP